MPEPAHSKHEAHGRLVARLRQQADDVRHITSGLDESAFAKRTVPDKWSLKELVCHLHRVQQVFEERLDAMLTQENPTIARYDPEGDQDFERMTGRSAAEALTRFLEDRERLAQRLEKLSPAEWHRPGRHPEFAHFDVHFQIEYMGHHEAHHVYQMFQRRVPLGKLPH
jgi:hypothetical protein